MWVWSRLDDDAAHPDVQPGLPPTSGVGQALVRRGAVWPRDDAMRGGRRSVARPAHQHRDALSLVVLTLRAITVAAAVSRPQADDQSSALPSPCDNKRVAYTAGDTRRQVA